MNNEQLSDFLVELSQTVGNSSFNSIADKREETEIFKKFLNKSAPNTLFAVNYIASNYTDIDLIQSIIGQILALYYKGGILRLYALQFVPGFVSLYLLALSKKQQKSVTLFETFFIAIYNEEIVADPSSNTKKVEEVRIPSIRYPSIYHDPSKIHSHGEIPAMRTTNIASVLTTIKIGPYPTYSRMIAENKFVILIRILQSVTQSLFDVSSEVVSRHICLASLSICQSGFSFPETGFRNKVLETEQSQECVEDFSRKPRQQISQGLLNELLTGCYLALFNGSPDLALRAIDAIHLRAQYEMLPEVLLVVNSIRNSLLDNPLSKEKRGELMWTRPSKDNLKRKDMVTNASLRIKRMPEDIPIQEQIKEKEHSRLGELVEEGMDHLHDLKRKVVGIGLHHKMNRRRKSGEIEESAELQPIKEERSTTLETVLESEAGGASQSCNSPPKNGKKEEKIILNGEEIDRRMKDLTVIEHDYQKEILEKQEVTIKNGNGLGNDSEKGAFSISGLRHMDSDDFSTHR